MSRTCSGLGTSLEDEEPATRWSEGSFQRILVVLDGSKASRKALRMAISLAWQHDAELWALSVEKGLPRFPATVGEVQEEKERQDRYYGELQQQARELAGRRGVSLRSEVLPGRGATAITGYARQGGFDLVVLGGDPPGGFWRALTGTSSRVSRGASCSAMIVR